MEHQWTEEQKQNIEFFNDNVKEWLKNPDYASKYILIDKNIVQGIYDNFSEALTDAMVNFDRGHFIIKEIPTRKYKCFDIPGRPIRPNIDISSFPVTVGITHHETTMNKPLGIYLDINTDVVTGISTDSLIRYGYNLQVKISPSSKSKESPEPHRSIIVLANLDTGTSTTTIDTSLAEYLGLTPGKPLSYRTVSGQQTSPTYKVDVNFIEPSLSPEHDIIVNSGILDFNLERNADKRIQGNIGMLIGRDLMSHWNIVWDGVASTVRIVDHRHSRSS